MPTNPNHRLFAKVEAARQVLRDRAEEIIKEYLDIAAQAKAKGDFMTAAKALQWLIEHMPKDSEGVGIVDRSVDKDTQAAQTNNSPNIKIGIQLGGVKPKQLTGETVDATKSPAIVRVAAIPGHDVRETQ